MKTRASPAMYILGILLLLELALLAGFRSLLRANQKAKDDFNIHTITHSLDARYGLVETIKTTETMLPTG